MRWSTGIRVAAAAALVALFGLVSASGVEAKLGATLSASTASIGDPVTLTSAPNSYGVTQGGQAVTAYMLPGTTDPSNTACQATSAKLLGTLGWNQTTGVGTLAFRVPAMSAGDHLVEVLLPNAFPGCFPEATLTVLATTLPATDAAPPASAPGDSGWLLLCITTGVIGAAMTLLRPQRTGPVKGTSPTHS